MGILDARAALVFRRPSQARLERLPPSHDPHVEDSGSGARLSWSLPTVSDSTIPWSRPLSGNT